MAKVLVVDDEPDMIWAITNVLLAENHSVVSVNSGEEALAKIKEVMVDLVLLDFRLPGMDGVQILEKIKQLRPELPVIMVTGYGGIEEAVQSIKLGAAHYIAKPFDNNHLIETVNKSLQLTSLKKEGLFGKRVAEKIAPQMSPAIEKAAVQTPYKEPPQRIAPRSSSPWMQWIAFGALLLFLGAGFFYYWNHTRKVDLEHPIAHSHVSGLSWEDDLLWACDWFSQSIYQYRFEEGQLLLVKSFLMPGSHFTGLVSTGESLYTCDSTQKTITKHALNQTLSALVSVPSPGPNPSGLFYDGSYLWSCDGNTRKIYKHALDENLTLIATYDGAATFPVGVYKDASGFWSAGVKGRIYKHSLEEGFKLDKILIFPRTGETQNQVSSFTMRDGKVWMAYEGVNKIFQRSMNNLKETSQ